MTGWDISGTFTLTTRQSIFRFPTFREASLSDSLEVVDISVHCDIKIFGWLMHYVSTENKDNLPILDDDNIIPVLVSAAFLKVHYAILSDLVSFYKYFVTRLMIWLMSVLIIYMKT